ncbi:MAG: YceI family protein [Thiobacillus sp.]|jgi:polyisoprenoid-binding protein YceI
MKKLALVPAFALATLLAPAVHAAPETFVIDGTHTFPRFEYSHFGYSRQANRFDRTSGTVTLDRAAQSGSVDVVIDAASVSTGYAVFDQHLRGEDFFDVAKHPNITFKSESMKFDGDKLKQVEGVLTIKGIARPVTLEVNSFHCMPHPMRKKDACGANATTQIKRSDFNMGKHVPHVSDEVVLSIPIEAIKP